MNQEKMDGCSLLEAEVLLSTAAQHVNLMPTETRSPLLSFIDTLSGSSCLTEPVSSHLEASASFFRFSNTKFLSIHLSQGLDLLSQYNGVGAEGQGAGIISTLQKFSPILG